MAINPAWIAAGVDAALGAVSAFGQHKANKSTQANAREQMDFQREMSNTSYQRAMKDMRDAGLNPILAYSQGGASSPGGATSIAQDALSKGVSSAQDSRRVRKEIEAMSSQKAVNESLIQYQKALTAQANSATNLNMSNALLAKANTKLAYNNDARANVDPKVVAGKLVDNVISGKAATAWNSWANNVKAEVVQGDKTSLFGTARRGVQKYFKRRNELMSKR